MTHKNDVDRRHISNDTGCGAFAHAHEGQETPLPSEEDMSINARMLRLRIAIEEDRRRDYLIP